MNPITVGWQQGSGPTGTDRGLKCCLAFFLLSAPLDKLLSVPGAGFSTGAGIKAASRARAQAHSSSTTHSLTHQQGWTCQRYSSEHYRCRPYPGAAYLLLLFILPKKHNLVHKVVMEKDPVRGTRSPRCVLSVWEMRKALFLPA